ncbi:MAG: hypothetical protein IJO93_06385 [Clostridia bacterium]|nr:hypothetical protein [Clostridia bacterium]
MLSKLQEITNGHAMETVIIIAALIIFRVIFSLIMAVIAKKKGYGDWLFFICLIFGIYGYIIVAALPDKILTMNLQTKPHDDVVYGDSAVLPQTGETEPPSGTTAYRAHSVSDSAREQNGAVERVKEYWTKKQ